MNLKKILRYDYEDLNSDPLTRILLPILVGTILAQIIIWSLGL